MKTRMEIYKSLENDLLSRKNDLFAQHALISSAQFEVMLDIRDLLLQMTRAPNAGV